MPGRELCLLSLDGGGVRGLSSLAILKRLMENINPEAPPKPCEYFDMIGGTSTGGLMAIMLGRLEMDIDECIEAYVALSDRVFRKKQHRIKMNGQVQGRFDTAELEQSIRDMMKQKTSTGEDTLLKGPEGQKCKIFVCAMSKETADTVLFTSYPSRWSSDLYNKTRIWEAARATSAASSFFDPIKIGQFEEEFVDGAVGANNPAAQLWNEAKYAWRDEKLEDNIKCFVSIGTGVPSLIPYGSNLLEIAQTLKYIATETEKTAETFHRAHSDLDDGNRYFRFNVTHGLENVGLEDATQKNVIIAATTRYVATESVMKQMRLCGTNLSTKEYDGPYKVSFSLKGLPLVSKFIPRDEEMDDLKSNLYPSSTRARRRKTFILHGLGGSGKTQLAIEFMRSSKNIFSSIFWLNGENRESIRQSFIEVARKLPHGGVPDFCRQFSGGSKEELDKVVNHVLTWFNQDENNRWLLVLDNVDRDSSPEANDPQSFDIDEFLPEADHGSVLITSRLQILGQYGNNRKIGRMSMSQGLGILHSKIGRSLEGLEKIVELVGYLPLALAHAGSFIHGTATDVNEYIRFYKETWANLFDNNQLSQLKDYPHSVLSTYTISYEHIKRVDTDAVKILDLFAYLDNSDLWYSLFTPLLCKNVVSTDLPQWFQRALCDELTFKRKMQTLLAYSMIEIRYDLASYAVHPVIHSWCCHSGNRNKNMSRLAIFTISSACSSMGQTTTWEYRKRLSIHCIYVHSWIELTRIFDDNETRDYPLIQSFSTVGSFLLDLCKLAEAEAMYQRALKGSEKALGPDHTSTLDTVNNLGALYSDQGKLTEAEAMYQRALKGREKALGPDHTSTLDTINNLGNLYRNQGKLAEAEAMYQRALKGYEKALGPDHTSTLDIVNNLGALYSDQGKLTEAEAMYQRALKGKEKALGPDHTSTLDTVNNLGLLYSDQGKLAEAEAMYQRALKGSEKALGPDHTSTLDTVNNLGLLYSDQGKLAEAKAMCQRALKGKEKALGPDHTSTLDTVNNLGLLYSDQGKLAEAEAMYQQALKGYEKALGPDHTSTLNTVNNLGALYSDQGKLTEAEAMYQRALKGKEKALGPDHTSTLDTVNNLGLLYSDQGKLAEAEAMYQRALKGFEKALGPDHAKVTSVAEFLQTLGKRSRRRKRDFFRRLSEYMTIDHWCTFA
ncbi:MAG: hypothetical protein M1814_000925 [Vezdaea aestivalis]|nr:MAG: hypothetical protein M1814_000925 [Vezdaea aestivalis]